MICIVFVFCAATAIASSAQILTTLHSFAGYPNDGANPVGGMVQANDGGFYGTTYTGGANGQGTVFKITAGGTLMTLHSFSGADGANPWAGLVQATDGNFYGTTYVGGANDSGTVFTITPSGTLTTLHSFDRTDGANPSGGLVQATDGNFYGTTYLGGANDGGTVFKITPSGALTTLYSFGSQPNDGAYPTAGLLQASDGNFYGTTYYGGYAWGTVFKITPSGTLTTLYIFCSQSGCSDGADPATGLVQAPDGKLYGTTTYYGYNGYGTVFKITPAGTLTTLHSFDGTDGEFPATGLVQASDGNFYGTTYRGGANDAGTVFKITPSGTLTTLHTFSGSDGANPLANLVQAGDGNFYGTTYSGGANRSGTVFRLVSVRPCFSCSLEWR